MTKGFIIYALGHKNYYRMAETLAASLLVNNANVKVALLCDAPEKLLHGHLFNKVIPLDVSQFEENDKLVFNRATIAMYEHSPYDETIKLDADMIWLNGRNPMQLFEMLAGYEVMFSNRGHGWGKGNSVWATEADLKAAYGFTDADKLYKIYGEFVYFRRCQKARKFFSLVKKAFYQPKVRCAEFSNGTFTDELAYQIACIQMGIELKENYTPIFNTFLGYNQFRYGYELAKSGYYGYSIGGNVTPPWIAIQYNNLAKHYYYQLGLQNPYQVRDKRSFLPERVKL